MKDNRMKFSENNFNIFDYIDKKIVSFAAGDIKESKDIEEMLSLQHLYFEQLFSNSPEAIALLDKESRIMNVNKSFQELFQYSLEELRGEKISDMICHAHHHEESMALLDSMEKDTFIKKELIRIDKYGREISVELLGFPIFYNEYKVGIYAIYTDITERKEYESQLKLFKKIYDNSLEGVVVTDKEGTIQWTNKAFTRITGYHEEEAIGKNPRILKSGRHPEAFYKHMWDSILTKGKWQGEIWNKKKNGEVYPEWLSISSIIDEDEEITHFTAVLQDISDQKNKEEAIRLLAYRDSLTQLYNRNFFIDRLEYEIHKRDRYRDMLGILFLDLDGFKKINDTFGHIQGDRVLRIFSSRLKKQVRKLDVVARYGGDEFVVLLPQIQDVSEAIHVAERIIGTFEKPFILDEHEVFLSVSIGISIYPNDGLNANTLIKNADMAMYNAKTAQKNKVELYSPLLAVKAKEEFMMTNYLRYALEKGEFELYYQPILCGKGQQIIGVEALLRWNHPDRGNIPPTKFIPILEDNGLIYPVGEWVLQRACGQLKEWIEKYELPLFMSINISLKQLEQNGFADKVKAIIKETGIDPCAIVLEITESIYMEKFSGIIHTLKEFQTFGLKISIDDFGTGYSSLSQLNRLDISCLKIDKSFIQGMDEDSNTRKIVTAIISMAKSLKLNIVAEGVETIEQLNFLMKKKCTMVQGYLFSKPLPVGDLELLLHKMCLERYGEN